MEPCGTPCSIFVQLLNVLFIFIFSLRWLSSLLSILERFYEIHKHELLLSKEIVANSQILLLKGLTYKIYVYFDSYLSVKWENATNNNNNNNPHFKNILDDLNADKNTNPPNPPNPLNPLNPSNPLNPPNPSNRPSPSNLPSPPSLSHPPIPCPHPPNPRFKIILFLLSCRIQQHCKFIDLQPASLLKKRLWCNCFPVSF